MPVHSNDFDGTFVVNDTYGTYGYVDVGYFTTVDGGVVQFRNLNSYTQEGSWWYQSRFKGNVTIEISFKVHACPATSGQNVHFGFAEGDDDNLYSGNQIFLEIQPNTATHVQISGISPNQDLAIGTIAWIKFIDNGSEIEVWYKEDGGTYTQLNDMLDRSIFDLEQGVRPAVFFENRSPYDDIYLRFNHLSVTADTADIFDNWPTDIDVSFQYPDLHAFSGYGIIEDEVLNFQELWGTEAYDNNIWYKDWSINQDFVQGGLVFEWVSGSGDTGAKYLRHTGTWYNLIQEVDFIVRFKCLNQPGQADFIFGLKDYARTLGITMSISHSDYPYGVLAVSNHNGVTSESFVYFSQWPIPYNSWQEFRFVQTEDNHMEVYWRIPPNGWILLGTSALELCEFFNLGGVVPYFLFDNYNADFDEVQFKYVINTLQSTSRFNAQAGDMVGLLAVEVESPRALWGSGWEYVLSYDAEFDGEIGDTDQSKWFYPVPLQLKRTLYTELSSTTDLPLRVAAKIRGDVVMAGSIDDLSAPTADYPYVGLRFTVNGVECFVGLFWDTVGLMARFGAIVDGTDYIFSLANPGASYDWTYTVKLEGTHFSIEMHISNFYLETVYDNTNFLSSPAEYITTDIEWVRETINAFTDIYDFEVFGQEALALDLEGDITASFELNMAMVGYKAAPVPASPGYFFHRTEIQGGGENSLDGLDPENLEDTGQQLKENSTCLVITAANDIYVYRAYEEAGQVESFPDIIIPDTNAGDWYWERVPAKQFQPALLQKFYNLSATVFTPFDQDYLFARQIHYGLNSSGQYVDCHTDLYQDGQGIRAWIQDHVDVELNVLSIPFSQREP